MPRHALLSKWYSMVEAINKILSEQSKKRRTRSRKKRICIPANELFIERKRSAISRRDYIPPMELFRKSLVPVI